MMIATLLTGLLLATALFVALSLADSAVRWRHAFAVLKHEQALARAGFVPQVEADPFHLRPAPALCRSSIRPFARRLPRRINPQQTVAAV